MRVGFPMGGWQMAKLLALWLLAGAVQAQDDPPGRVGRLAVPQGEVWVQDPGQGDWVAALPNRPFTGGERLATGADGSVELRIGSTVVFLGAQTEFEALRLDDERMQFRLQRGQMALRLLSPEVASEVEVVHPEARFRPLRAGLYRIDRLGEASDAGVWRGDLQVDGYGLSMTIYAGQRAAFWRDGGLGDTVRQWLTQQEDAFAVAVLHADRVLAQLPPMTPVPVEMTGIEDLPRYGVWQQHPEVGAVWIPTVVAAGWAPYRQGQWVWLRPWGWTWVDAAPWGFAPFHYGRWLWWGNRWCWTPGPRVARPVFAPALVGWVGPPPAPGGVWGGRPPPAQGWVPLGPREAYRPSYPASPRHVQRLNPFGATPPPAYVNHGVPGAVGQWSRERPPAGYAGQQAGDMAGRRQWQAEEFRRDAPGRAQREQVTPRAALPMPTPTAQPAHPVAPGNGTAHPPARPSGPFHPPSAAQPQPQPQPQPQHVPRPPPATPPMPAHPPQAAPRAPAAAPTPMPPQPPQAQQQPRGQAGAQGNGQAGGPFGGRPVTTGRDDSGALPERVERRRTPESRGNARER